MFNRTVLLFFIIFLEGYVVLATELLSIRLLIPFVGSGTEVIAIIISAVLLPLAFGYHWGGNFAERQRRRLLRNPLRYRTTIRRKMIENLMVSLVVLTFGLSYIVHEMLFGMLHALHIQSIVLQTTVFCLLFVVYPTFLLGQTVPLVSHYFAKKQLSKMTGRMLAFSTTGSFAGSVFTTVVLMMTIGVHNSVILVLACIVLMIFLLDRKIGFRHLVVLAVFGMGYSMNNSDVMRELEVVSNNAYNIVQVYPQQDNGTIFSVNRSNSSRYTEDRSKMFAYLRHIEDNIISRMDGDEPKHILVIGAGGFTIGLDDDTNHYTFIDIDPDLQKVAEETFLPEKLGPNKRFIPMSARAFLTQNSEKFDLIILDAYTNTISIPLECTTQEFFQSVKTDLAEGGIVVANIISRPDFSDAFTVRMHNTFSSVFPLFTRQVVQDYNAWTGEIGSAGQETREKHYYANILYVYYDGEFVEERGIYTDDKTTYSSDKDLF